MAPKKKEQQQKMSLGDFLTDSGFGGGSWADEVEETYVTGTQPLPPSDRPRPMGGMSSWQDRAYAPRDFGPQPIPDKPPYTAHLGNLSYDATMETVEEFFEGCDVASVRIIEDREMMRPKGFGYVEFANVDGLKKALDLDGQSFQGRMIKIKVADPPRGGDGRMDSSRDLTDWTRKGPLPDLPGQRSSRQPSDFGPLSPLAQQEFAPRPRDDSRPRPAPEGLGERSESFRGNRPGPPAWGEGRQEGSRPPRRDQPERVVTAAEKDTQWRDRMRPDAPVKSSPPSREGSEAPSSPSMPSAVAAVGPAVRPRLNLQKRTVSEVTESVITPTGSGDTKASPFGAARPIDTATKEKEIEEKRQQSVREKREAEEKAKEERRVAKQAAAAKAEADAQEQSAKELEEKAAAEKAAAEAKADSAQAEKQNGESAEQKVPIRSQEPREPKDQVANPKSRAAEAGSWSGPRGGRGGGAPRGARVEGRGGRTNGSPTQPAAPAGESPVESPNSPDEDGWTTVPNKKGRQGRPVAS
ncbi:RNA recognition motif domain-containing protein [Hirsutella rhossiliensis]|uniref:RNA recognition motif domain-containing protein n=1 Tax=Hirsutella rhossiliensis TaxID=111463 RepID=A0A9P8MT77_9HYPO|nr:RNA recognition motif domain-containing protein [Hirsutella rhossiliensis]KAH0959984.1 RNA recognition motif domain-containing protein [Hirsutella rhossiliensis]